jgi:hypothetical protein
MELLRSTAESAGCAIPTVRATAEPVSISVVPASDKD